MLDPVIGILIAACFAALFASAAIHKLRDLVHFDAIFAAYGLLPAARLPISRAVPVLEMAVALGLLSAASRGFAAGTGAVLLLAYASAIALNLRRGRRDIACGCGGPDERRPIGWPMVWRNCALAAVLAAATLSWRARALAATDALTIVGGVSAAALLYMSLDRLLGHAARRTAELRAVR